MANSPDNLVANSLDNPIVDVDLLGVHQVGWAQEIETTALRFTIIFGVIQLVTVMILEWSRELTPLYGQPGSVGSHAIISTIILGLIITPIAFLRGIRYRDTHKSVALHKQRHWAVVPVTIGVTLVISLLVVGGFEIFARTFQDVMMDRASSATVLVLVAGILAYLVTREVMASKTAEILVNLSAFYLLATLFFSAYFNDNPLWWQKSFSYLGMTESNSRYIFDIGLVFTGILIVAWQYYFMESITVLESHGVVTERNKTIVRWVLVLAGVLLSFVGIFRFGISTFFNIVHDVSATGMGVMVAILMLFLYRLVPGYTRVFYAISVLMALMIASAAVMKILGNFNLVGLELAGFALATLWLVLFYRNTELLLAQTIKRDRTIA